ncbi:hypothetical protein CRUP_013507, partial [Coryphaenoides rupestris]
MSKEKRITEASALTFPRRMVTVSSFTVIPVEMKLYIDHTFTSAYSRAPTIQLRNKVYVEVSVSEPKDFFVL